MSFRVEELDNDEDAPRHISHVDEADVQVDKNISLSVAEVKVSHHDFLSPWAKLIFLFSGIDLLRIR